MRLCSQSLYALRTPGPERGLLRLGPPALWETQRPGLHHEPEGLYSELPTENHTDGMATAEATLYTCREPGEQFSFGPIRQRSCDKPLHVWDHTAWLTVQSPWLPPRGSTWETGNAGGHLLLSTDDKG